MSYNCPVCNYNGLKHFTLYGVKLLNECSVCLSLDDNIKIDVLECNHTLHNKCINKIINRPYSTNNIDIIENYYEVIPIPRLQRLYQKSLSNKLYYNELGDLSSSYILLYKILNIKLFLIPYNL